jgi:glycosyltransferase involved in cell wall biosynthesis
MRIGHVIGSLGIGGAEKLTRWAFEELEKRGHVNRLWTLREEGHHFEQLRRRHEQVRHLGGSPGTSQLLQAFPILMRLRKELIAFQPDVVHAHLFKTAVLTRLAAIRTGIPVVVTLHRLEYPRLEPLVERIFRLSTAAYIVDSRAVRRLLAGWGIAEASISVIPNAVDPAELDAPGDGTRIRREMEIPSGAPVVGVIAHLFPEKGHDFLLESFARASFPPGQIFLLIVGSGPLRDRLEHQAAVLGIGSSVRFTGNRADLNDILAAIDLCVLPSRWEGFGIVLAEALYKNVPVVATRGSGTEEIVEDGVTGALVDFGDVGALAAALQRGLFDSSWRKKTTALGREKVLREFTLEALASRLEDVYRTVSRGGPL